MRIEIGLIFFFGIHGSWFAYEFIWEMANVSVYLDHLSATVLLHRLSRFIAMCINMLLYSSNEIYCSVKEFRMKYVQIMRKYVNWNKFFSSFALLLAEYVPVHYAFNFFSHQKTNINICVCILCDRMNETKRKKENSNTLCNFAYCAIFRVVFFFGEKNSQIFHIV